MDRRHEAAARNLPTPAGKVGVPICGRCLVPLTCPSADLVLLQCGHAAHSAECADATRTSATEWRFVCPHPSCAHVSRELKRAIPSGGVCALIRAGVEVLLGTDCPACETRLPLDALTHDRDKCQCFFCPTYAQRLTLLEAHMHSVECEPCATFVRELAATGAGAEGTPPHTTPKRKHEHAGARDHVEFTAEHVVDVRIPQNTNPLLKCAKCNDLLLTPTPAVAAMGPRGELVHKWCAEGRSHDVTRFAATMLRALADAPNAPTATCSECHADDVPLSEVYTHARGPCKRFACFSREAAGGPKMAGEEFVAHVEGCRACQDRLDEKVPDSEEEEE